MLKQKNSKNDKLKYNYRTSRKGRMLMKNIEMTIEGNILTIKVDLSQRFGKSSSGKSTIVASTEGNQAVPGNEEIKIGLNVYTK